MKLENQTYTRLDDDVSFQILRTNPKLTTNTKLMYDGKSLFMEAYGADPLLVTRPYKAQKVLRTGLFNNDIKNFISGAKSTTYTVGQNMSNLVLGTTFDNQFETMYWAGVESLPSYTYEEEMGCIAPLYLRKKLPEYFVVFRVDTPANTNLTLDDATHTMPKDSSYYFKTDVLQTARIIKTFDLGEGTPIGDYIRNYTGQKSFKYDQSIYVNFSSDEIYYYGIDKSSGVLTQKVESISEQMLDNDYTILRTDERITCGFERNDLIFPYIINFEFLFNDDELSGDNDYKFARYFGMYCNAIDIQETLVTGLGTKGQIFTDWSDKEINNIKIDGYQFFYIKDKYNNLHSITKELMVKEENMDIDACKGYEVTTTPVYAERMDGMGYSTMMLKVENVPADEYKRNIIIDIQYEDGSSKRYRSDISLEKGSYKKSGYFSCKGEPEDIAKAIAGLIKDYPPNDCDWLTAYAIDDEVYIEALGANSFRDETLEFKVEGNITKKLDAFKGGTDVTGCLFKIKTEDMELFFNDDDPTRERYVKCRKSDYNAKIKAILPYINEYKEHDETYSVLVTDWYGPYVKVAKNNHIELIDDYYAKVGLLSFFPVRDFDFDTLSSGYGDGSLMQEELEGLSKTLMNISEDSDEEVSIPYGRFFTETGDELKTEYDYYCENIVPELCTTSKTTPYIVKWGYADESKDSCENPYRFNTSKIFDACNFSANTFVTNGDIMEYTHSMPYYVVNGTWDKDPNQYQYIYDEQCMIENYAKDWTVDDDGVCEQLDNYIKKWTDWFSNTKEDHFNEMFGDCSTSNFSSKRFNKKYSRFLNGTTVNNASTLFRGVKFEIIEISNGKETKTGKYNGYKFSFIYIPSGGFSSKVYFVKNDTFKFIVGMVFFKISEGENIPFSKANVYAGAMGFLSPYKTEDDETE